MNLRTDHFASQVFDWQFLSRTHECLASSITVRVLPNRTSHQVGGSQRFDWLQFLNHGPGNPLRSNASYNFVPYFVSNALV
jgi:hypothetical protein